MASIGDRGWDMASIGDRGWDMASIGDRGWDGAGWKGRRCVMPIRTNRGRAVVYRRLWAWPLRSPRHLAITGLVLAVLATVIGLLMPDSSGPRAAQLSTHPTSTSPSASPTGSRGQTSTSPARSTTPRPAPPAVTTTPPSSAPPAPEALNVASAWARAWVHHPAGMTSQDWVAQLAPLTTEEFIPQLSTVDPANIPSTAVTGPPTPTSSTARAVELNIPTDGALLHLTLIATPDGWRVSAYNRSE